MIGPRSRTAPPGVSRGGRSVGIRVASATDGKDMLINSPDGWEVDSPWMWWDGPAGGDGTGGPLGNPPPGAGLPLSLPAAVTRCTSLIADTIGGLPWQVFRDDGQEKLEVPDWVADPQARRIDRRISGGPFPEWRKTKMEFRSSTIVSLLWQGEGMIYIPVRDSDGTPVPPVWQINPDDVGISDDGRWQIGQGGDGSDDQGYTFAPGELLVIRGMMRGADIRGLGVLQAHWAELGLAQSMREFANNMLREGIPNGYLKVNSPQLTRDKAYELQREWMRQHGGPRKRIAVLNATTDFHALGLDPAALQLAQMRDYSLLDIALMFGVPPWFLGIRTDSNTYANITSRMIELAQFTLLPWCRRIEAAYDAEFARGTEMRINLDGLRRADTLTRYQAHQLALGDNSHPGWMDVDEVRELENMPPLTAGQRERMGLTAPASVPAILPPLPSESGSASPAAAAGPPQLRALEGRGSEPERRAQ